MYKNPAVFTSNPPPFMLFFLIFPVYHTAVVPPVTLGRRFYFPLSYIPPTRPCSPCKSIIPYMIFSFRLPYFGWGHPFAAGKRSHRLPHRSQMLPRTARMHHIPPEPVYFAAVFTIKATDLWKQ
jgi:hypothetical protein